MVQNLLLFEFSSIQQQVEETASVIEEASLDGGDILKEIFPNEPATPTGIMWVWRWVILSEGGFI